MANARPTRDPAPNRVYHPIHQLGLPLRIAAFCHPIVLTSTMTAPLTNWTVAASASSRIILRAHRW
jgi:hypothetical protein